ncbi:MAG: NHL repeat-containing protein, partial [Planctomycetota bacterium]|nr:NHL repeat-containing protein [Planctomycetota bacterium]
LDREAGTIRESVLPPSGDAPSVDERPACFLVPPGDDPGGAGVIELRLENLPGGPRSIELPAAGIEPLADVVRVRPLFDGEAITGFLFLERAPHRLRALDLDGRERFSTGGKGAGEGAFNFPADVAVDSRGRCYVADTDNHRIQRFGPDGRFQLAWGGRGAFPGLLAAPSSIDVEGDLVYIAEELNHRVSVFDTDGRFQYQWGMHAVVPREGEGRIHYPTCLDVSADGSRAVVLEPFERRIQCFTRLPGGLAEARSSPMPAKQDVSSHFGAQVAAEDDLLAMWEPETGSIAVFDVTTDTGLNITVFTNHGSGWDDLGRLGALHLDGARQELVVSDPVNDRLMTWRLERDRSTPIAYDPFMARLTSAIESEAMLADLRRLDPDRSWRRPRITGLARAGIDGAPLVAVDRANDVLLELDAR